MWGRCLCCSYQHSFEASEWSNHHLLFILICMYMSILSIDTIEAQKRKKGEGEGRGGEGRGGEAHH